MEAAILEAKHGIECRIKYPQCVVRDPNSHELMVLETIAFDDELKKEEYLNEGPR
jgi:hypothetical protein